LEPLLSRILSKWVIGSFCVRYLSHIHELIREETGLNEKITAETLSDEGKIRQITRQLGSHKKYGEILEKDILPALKTILDQGEAESLTDLTRLAHAGDYLLSALEDLRKHHDPDYPLWVESVPTYYETDVRQMDLLNPSTRSRRIPLTSWISNLEQHLPICEPVEAVGKTFTFQTPRKERRRALLGLNRRLPETQ
jgi:hypothetical protein